MDWFRWYHGTVSDPKWRVVAARARNAMERHVTTGNVVAVWASMLERASQSTPRGRLDGWSDEDCGAALDIDVAEVTAIRVAMEGKTIADNALISWEKRQPKREREDTNSTERVRAHREREKQKESPRNATKHQETPRGEESREEEKALHSVGKSEQEASREAPPAAPDARAPEEAGAEPPAEPSAAQRVADALTALGITHVNPSHAQLRALLADGVPPEEIIDAARELRASKGGGNLAYVCAAVRGRRSDAAGAGTVAAAPRAPTPAAHKPYVPEKRARAGPDAPIPEAVTTLAKQLGIQPTQP